MPLMQDEPRSRGIRRKLHMTQKQFAKRYKIPLQMIQNWERGKAKPDNKYDEYLTIISREPGFVADLVRERDQ